MSKIYINPGHGGKDSGAVGVGGRLEKVDNLKLAAAVAEKLKKAGHTVRLERNNDEYISVTEIAKKANHWGADLFIAFHRNAANGTAQGAECLIVPNASKTSRVMAQTIVDALAYIGFKNRGVKVQSKNVYVLSHTTMPATTIEVGFIDNKTDNIIFDKKFDDIVNKLTSAILSVALGVEKPTVEPPKEPSKKVPVLERVLKFSDPMMKGEDVKAAQERLLHHGANVGAVDGIFGEKTKAAVIAFQTARIKEGRDVGCRYNGNKADGKIGQLTWAILWE